MKRKIQHDAVNNQEDEDSSAYPVYFPSDEVPDKKASVENTIIHLLSETSGNKDEVTGNQKYP